MPRPGRDVEIIPLLPVDGALPAWSREAAAEPVGGESEDGGSRGRGTGWAVALVGLIVVGALVALAVAIAHVEDERPAPTATSLPGVGTTTPGPLSPVGPAADGVFLLDDPALRPYAADIDSPADEREAFSLWTSTSASAVMTVQVSPTPADAVFFVDAVRRVVDGRELVSLRRALDVTHVVVDLGDGGSATVTTTNVADDQIVRLLNGLVVRDRTWVDDTSGAIAELGLSVAATAHTQDELLKGVVATESRYLDAAGEMVTLTVGENVAVASASNLLAPFATDIVTTADGRVAGVRRDTGESIVVWQQDGHQLTLTAALAPLQLLDLSKHVRGGTAEEWRGLVAALHPDFVLGRYSVLAQDAPGTRDGWRAGVQLASRGGRPQFLLWWTEPGSPDVNDSVLVGDLTGRAAVSYVVVRGATYVFVSVPPDGGHDTVTVTGADLRESQVQLQQPFADQPVRIGVARVESPGAIDAAP